MIVGSLLLIVVAVGLLVAGLMRGSDPLLVASIGASLLAAVALIVGGRQAAAARSSRNTRTGRQVRDEDYSPIEESFGASLGAESDLRTPVGAGARAGSGSGAGGTTYGRGGVVRDDETSMMPAVRDTRDPRDEPPVVPQQPFDNHEPAYGAPESQDWSATDDDDDDFDDDPEDEPAIQQSSPGDLARVAGMSTDVLVIDGRPRYHVRGCMTLLGRDNEPLPIGEAVELGFTPCAACNPNDAVLAGRA